MAWKRLQLYQERFLLFLLLQAVWLGDRCIGEHGRRSGWERIDIVHLSRLLLLFLTILRLSLLRLPLRLGRTWQWDRDPGGRGMTRQPRGRASG